LTQNFKKNANGDFGKPESGYRDLFRLFSYLKPHLKSLTLAALLLMGVSTITLGILWKIRGLVDLVMVQHDFSALTTTIYILVVFFLLQSILSIGQSYMVALVGQKIIAQFRNSLFRHLESLSLGFFSKRRTGEILSRLTNDVGTIQTISTTVPVDLAKQGVILLGAVGILIYMNWKLCLMILIVVPFVILTAKVFGRKLKALSTAVQDRMAETSTILEEVISGIRIVKSFVREDYEADRFKHTVNQTLDLALKKAWVFAVFIPVITFLTLMGAAGVLWYGGYQVIQGNMTPGDLVAFVLYGGILMGPFSSFARVFSQLKEVQGATKRVFEILDLESTIPQNPQAPPLPPLQGKVTFHGVGFSYEPGAKVLKNISFKVAPGQVIALVGPSGAGKTTLLNLLHRFYDPTEGWIEIDGQPIREVQLKSLYSQFGLVSQETILFGGTIRENILYGQLDAGEDEIVAAAKAANAHPFISALPRGYQTIVGEKGINLSGGQRQRIAIARAILKRPRLLLLDEATSSLDNESEMLIQEALQRLMEGKTTFVIAHRLTTVQNADIILTLEDGEIVEKGTHTELLNLKGLYHHLYTVKWEKSEDWLIHHEK
jgi:subfamily B ATP-binding cassette protein MsbA